MALFKVDVWVPLGDNNFLRKVSYYFETETIDAAKARAVEQYVKNEVPQLIAVSWEGPIVVEKTPTLAKKKSSGSSGTS